MSKRICVECGRKKKCVKSWEGINQWVWMCWDCLEAEEDGYVVCLG